MVPQPIPCESYPHRYWLGIFHNVGPDPHNINPCSICQDEVKPEDKSSRHVTCRNYFHTHCLEQWFTELEDSHGSERITCPMCRGVLERAPRQLRRDQVRNDVRNDIVRHAYDVGVVAMENHLPSLEILLESIVRRRIAQHLLSVRYNANPEDVETDVKLAVYNRIQVIEAMLEHEFGHESELEFEPEIYDGPAWTRHRTWRLDSHRVNRFLAIDSDVESLNSDTSIDYP